MGGVIDEGTKLVNGVGKMVGQATGFEGNDVNGYNIDQSAFNPNEQETGLTQALMARSRGDTPSVAEMQMKQGLSQAQGQAMGTAAAQRGNNPALAAHLAQQQQSGISQNGIQQTGMMRAQEQMANDQLLQQGLQNQRQGRMAGQQLAVSNNLGTEGIKNGAFDAKADRSASTLNSLGSAIATGAAHGGIVPGEVPHYALGGIVDDPGFINSFAQAVSQEAMQAAHTQPHKVVGIGPKQKMPGGGGPEGMMSAGGGESVVAPEMATMVASNGGHVPGKPTVPGDSPANDTVPTMLSPGEIVVPRTVAKMSPDKIAQFVMALRAG